MKKGTCFLFTLLVIVSAACATNPVTGKRQMSLLSEADEIAIGQQQDAEIRREMGVYNDAALQRYVNDIGQQLARLSHRPNLPWSFTIVDNPAINAFALPGGYIYLTRGILAYLDDEAELAGVLGHEIGHVTARHAAQAYTRQAQASVGLAILSIFVPSTAPFADLGSAGLSVLFLRHGREAELEADRLGVEYGSGAGYDPAGVPRFLATLARVDALSERGVPNWLSTHPDPGIARHEGRAPVASKFVSDAAKALNRDQYLERIPGMAFGDRVEDGIVRGNEFLHPLLRIRREISRRLGAHQHAQGGAGAGAGHRSLHGAAGSASSRPSPRLRSQGGRSIGDAAVAAMRQAGYTVVDGRIDRINGNEAHIGLYRGEAKDVGKVLMRAAHIAIGRQLYVVAGFAPEKEFEQVDKDILPAVQTFRQLSTAEAAAIRPNRIDFYVVKSGDSWQSIAARQGRNFVNAATLAIMNDREVHVQPNPGDRVKIVVEG